MPESDSPDIPKTRYFVVKPQMFVQGGTEEKAWEALSLALGTKISRLKYWFTLIETKVDPNYVEGT